MRPERVPTFFSVIILFNYLDMFGDIHLDRLEKVKITEPVPIPPSSWITPYS